jgi:hypothetical protein
MGKFFVWDKTDDIKKYADPGMSASWVEADSIGAAAWLYANNFAWSYYENDNHFGDYILHVLTEHATRLVFEKYPDDQIEQKAMELATHFRAVMEMNVTVIDPGEWDEPGDVDDQGHLAGV